MTTPLATIRSYDDLIDALKARKAGIGITDATLEEVTGLHSGYVGKIFGIAQVKHLGPLSFGLILQGLACKLVLVEDEEAAAKMAARWEQTTRAPRMRANASIPRARWLITNKTARKMVRSRVAKQTPERRKAIARKAAKARWRKRRKAGPNRSVPAVVPVNP